MKRTILIPILLIICITWSFAQDRSDLKGPKAKNYKPWLHKELPKTYVMTNKKERQGPVAKNHKVWNNENTNKEVINMKATSSKPQGPAAKNKKAWAAKNS